MSEHTQQKKFIYLFKVDKRNNRKRCKICSKLTTQQIPSSQQNEETYLAYFFKLLFSVAKHVKDKCQVSFLTLREFN